MRRWAILFRPAGLGTVLIGRAGLALLLPLLLFLAFTPATSAQPTSVVEVISTTNTWHCWWMGSDLGTFWRQPVYYDANWPNYAALAVRGQTWLSLTNPSGQPITTYYLRAGFALAADPADQLSVNATTGAGFAFTRYATALPVSAEVPVVVLGLAPFGSNFALSWPASAGQTGQPEMWATTNLATGPWLPFTGPLTTNFLVVTNATGQQFFRLKMP